MIIFWIGKKVKNNISNVGNNNKFDIEELNLLFIVYYIRLKKILLLYMWLKWGWCVCEVKF